MSVAEAVQTTSKASSSSSSGFVLQRKCTCGGSAGLSGECDQCKRNKLLGKPLQRKLAINEPGDEYEREADRVAEQVMRMPDPGKQNGRAPKPVLPLVQCPVIGNGAGVGAVPPIVHEVLSSPGQPLDAATRGFFDPRFGHDFRNVRIHSDTKASASARRMRALAYTIGQDIVFGAGQFASGTVRMNNLLAHELAHVDQQTQSGMLALQRKGDPRSTTAWEFAANYREYEPETYENLLAEVAPARESLESDALQGFLSESDLQVLVRLTALDLMNQYRLRIMSARDAVKVTQQPSEVVAGVSAASRKILTLDAERRILERSRSNIGSLAAQTNIGGTSPFTEEWAMQVAAYTKEYRNEDITVALQEFAAWVTEHQTVTEGDRSQGVMLLHKLEAARTKQIQDVSRRANKLYTQFPFLAQLWLRNPRTELAEALIGDSTGDIVSGAQAVSDAASSLIERFDPTGWFAEGRAYAEAQVTTAVRTLTGPSLSDFAENTFDTTSSYINAVRDGYDRLIENIDRAIGVIGSEDISSFELPEAVAAAAERLPANLKKELQQLRQRKELIALAETIGLSAAEAGLALLPVIGPALAFGAGMYSSVSGLESTLDRRTLGLAGETPEGALGVTASPAEVAMSMADVAGSALGIFELLDVPELDVPAPEHTRLTGSPPKEEIPITRPRVSEETGIAAAPEIAKPVEAPPAEIPALSDPASVVSPSARERLPDLTAQEESLLRNTADPAKYPAELPKELADQELDIVRRAEKTPIVDQRDGYISEVDLGNGHKWKGKEDGTWCRHSNGGTNCTNLGGGRPPDDIDLDEPIGAVPESSRLYQMIAQLDDLLIRSDRRYSGAIASLRERVAFLIEESPAGPLDPIAIDDLVGRFEELSRLVGDTTMLEGRKVPVIRQRERLRRAALDAQSFAVPSLALPREIAMYAPREFSGSAAEVTRRVMGNPPDLPAAFARVPRIPYQPGVDWPLRGQIYSHIAEGSSGAPVFLTTLRVGDRPRMVAVKLFRKRFTEYEMQEIVSAQIFGELGIGPQVFGVVEIEGHRGLVMEAVAGDFPEAMPMGQQAVWDLETAVERLSDAGIAIGDFQYLVTPDGRAVIIDAGAATFEGDSRYRNMQTSMERQLNDERNRLSAAGAEPELRERYRFQLEDRNQVRQRAREALAGEFQRLLATGEAGDITVEGVQYSTLRVSRVKDELLARFRGIENTTDARGRGELVLSAFEQAAIEVARENGIASTRVAVQLVVNERFRNLLNKRGYSVLVLEGIDGVRLQSVLSKVYPAQ